MNNLVPFTDKEEKFIKKIVDERTRVEDRFPLLAGLFVTFGFVCTLYGFEKLIDRVDLFVNNPWILLATGLMTLLITGAAYKKLN
jgi:hypothetical protein